MANKKLIWFFSSIITCFLLTFVWLTIVTCKILSLKVEKTSLDMELDNIDHNYAEIKSIRVELEKLISNVSQIDNSNQKFIDIMTSAHEDLSKSTDNSLGNIKSIYADQLSLLTENASKQLEQITYTNNNKISEMDKKLTKQSNEISEINKKISKQSGEISEINKKLTSQTSTHNADIVEINKKMTTISTTHSSDHRSVQDQITTINDKLIRCGCC